MRQRAGKICAFLLFTLGLLIFRGGFLNSGASVKPSPALETVRPPTGSNSGLEEPGRSRALPEGRNARAKNLALLGALEIPPPASAGERPRPAPPITPELAKEVAAIEARERQADETVWAREILAEECGRVIENLWDQIRANTNKLAVLGAFDAGEVLVPGFSEGQMVSPGILIRAANGEKRRLAPTGWPQFVQKFEKMGWRLETVEFRQNQFDVDPAGKPAQSLFYFAAHLENTIVPERASLEGDLAIKWRPSKNPQSAPAIKEIDATHLTLKTRRGPPPFQSIFNQEITPPENSNLIDPLIVHDLDGDGIPEILLVAKNLLLRRQPDGRYSHEALCQNWIPYIWTALLADFDGDGLVDLLCDKYEGLYLFKGAKNGTFPDPPRRVWTSDPPIRNSMVMTCGDIDHDGDLDVFLAQYEEPYADGATPNPYFDANDGNPAYLLLNDGRGNFQDATKRAGLARKRFRRSYSASLVDLNGDGNLDLIVVSDFAGLDLYRGDGKAHFEDVTSRWVADPHGFGMAHALADFNVDGALDLLMIGMTSPAVRRLDHLGLRRDDKEDPSMPGRMTFGNRLYLAKTLKIDTNAVRSAAFPHFEQNELSDSIARSGWSWGCGVFDFDNDGFPDVYIANGLESNSSVRDYESEYWLHDRFVGQGPNRSANQLYFRGKFSRTRARDYSYGGFEKNRLFLNQRGERFLEAGYLMGVALEADCRNVLAEDLDADGKVDLLVTTWEIWPRKRKTLRIFRNTLSENDNWIGFSLPGPAASAMGTAVTLHYGEHVITQQRVSGDSYRSQHSPTFHFGLGTASRVDSAEIRWPTGKITTLRNLEANRYISLTQE